MKVLSDILGFVMYYCYSPVRNYGVAIILFTLISKIVLLPISIWVQKNSIKMVKMQPEINRIKARFFGDKDRIADEQTSLFKKEKYNHLASMIPLIAQIVLLLNRKMEDRENSSRKFFFPKWHTEKLKRVLEQDIVPKDERTVLTAIEENYLDFFLAKKSRTFPEIMDCPLCMENEIFPDAEAGKRLKWNSANWLPAKVPIRYLELKGSKKCANSTITRSRKDYLDFISIILERNSSSF
jgi:hypothetical protein